MNNESSICKQVRDAEENLIHGNSKMGKYVDFQMYEVLQTIDAYLNSKHTSGLHDSLGRDKPFFNIVTAAANIWYRATDLDRKNIKIMPSKNADVGLAFLAGVHLQRWMNKNDFGRFLNLWGRALARYGSAVVKFVEKEGDLIPSVISWNRFIVDPIDFDAIPHIEKFYKTPAQLRKVKEYDQDLVKALVEAKSTRKNLGGETKDNSDNFIEIYEVHGELSVADYKIAKGLEPADGDDEIFKQQMHVVSFVGSGTKDASGEEIYEDFTLYCGYEKEDPYMITHLIEEDGRTLSIGAVEYLFDAQWMQNHSIKQWKDQLDLASKLIFQTADTNYVGRNILTNIEQGDIFIHGANMPLTLVNNQGHDSGSIQAFSGLWKMMSQDLTSTPDALRGSTQPSGTPYRLMAIQQQEAGSLFEVMTENKGIDLEKMLRRFVIPHLKKQLDTKEEIMASLDDQGLSEIDAMYIPAKAIETFNEKVKKEMLSPEPTLEGLPSPYVKEVNEQGVRDSMASLGNKRSFKPTVLKDGKEVDVSWKSVFSDFEWDNVIVEITSENKDKQSVMATLSSLYQTLAQTDPTKANLVLGKIMQETGVVSPLELTSIKSTTLPPPMAEGQPVGGVGQLSNNKQTA